MRNINKCASVFTDVVSKATDKKGDQFSNKDEQKKSETDQNHGTKHLCIKDLSMWISMFFISIELQKQFRIC